MENQKIVVLGTGGTIAGKAVHPGDNVGYTAGQVTVSDLLASVPGLDALVGEGLVAEQIAQLDSKDMTWSVWRALARRCNELLRDPSVRAVVVTHGTDTLEETAWFLASTLTNVQKPVVLTCAMRPSTSLAPDGPQNLLDAVSLARNAAAGVLIVAAGEIHDPQYVRKAHPYRVAAFTSDDVGPLGWMEEGVPRWAYPCLNVPVVSGKQEVSRAGMEMLFGDTDVEMPWVEIVMSHACAQPRQVDALVSAGVRGLVVACTGNGTVHQALEPALLRAQRQGVSIVRATRCTAGQIIAASHSAFAATAVSPVKARVSLMLDLLRDA